MIEELMRNDNPMCSAVIFIDTNNKIHIYNPAISIEEFEEKLKEM